MGESGERIVHGRELAERISARRQELGMTQTQLGERLGISYQQVQKYERGESKLTIDRLTQIATALDVDVLEILRAPVESTAESPTIPYDARVWARLDTSERVLIGLFRSIVSDRDRNLLIDIAKLLRDMK